MSFSFPEMKRSPISFSIHNQNKSPDPLLSTSKHTDPAFGGDIYCVRLKVKTWSENAAFESASSLLKCLTGHSIGTKENNQPN